MRHEFKAHISHLILRDRKVTNNAQSVTQFKGLTSYFNQKTLFAMKVLSVISLAVYEAIPSQPAVLPY